MHDFKRPGPCMRLVGTATIATMLVLALALSVPHVSWSQTSEESASAINGKTIYIDYKCNLCHSVTSAGIEAKVKSEKMKGPDLTGVTSKREPEWIAKYVRKQVQIEDRDHKPEFKGTDEELDALIAWLKEQTRAPSGQ